MPNGILQTLDQGPCMSIFDGACAGLHAVIVIVVGKSPVQWTKPMSDDRVVRDDLRLAEQEQGQQADEEYRIPV